MLDLSSGSVRHPVGHLSTTLFYHSEVFLLIFPGGKEKLSFSSYYVNTCVEFKRNASYSPNVTLMTPITALQYDLWCTVLPCVHYSGVLVIVVDSSSKINEFYIGISVKS